MGQKCAQGNSNGQIVAFFDAAISPAPSGATNIANITDAEWRDSLINPGKYQVVNSVFARAPGRTQAGLDAEAWLAYQGRARAALADSDTTMHRIAEGVAVGSTSRTVADVTAFVQWRQALRTILSQPQPDTIPSSLPVKPSYPAGT